MGILLLLIVETQRHDKSRVHFRERYRPPGRRRHADRMMRHVGIAVPGLQLAVTHAAGRATIAELQAETPPAPAMPARLR